MNQGGYKFMSDRPTIKDTPTMHLTREIIEYSIIRSPQFLCKLPHHLVDYALCELAVENKYIDAIQYVPEDLIDHNLMVKAIQYNSDNILWLMKRKLATRDLIKISIEKNPRLIKYVIVDKESPGIVDKDFYLSLSELCVSIDGTTISDINFDYLQDIEFVNCLYRNAVLNNGRAILNIPEQYTTKELWNIAVKSDGSVLLRVPKDVEIDDVPTITVEQECYKTNPCKHNVIIGKDNIIVGAKSIKCLLDRWGQQTNDMYDHVNSYFIKKTLDT